MADQNKPSIVFAHGLWADGSCFQKLIPALQADGHEVMCSRMAWTLSKATWSASLAASGGSVLPWSLSVTLMAAP